MTGEHVKPRITGETAKGRPALSRAGELSESLAREFAVLIDPVKERADVIAELIGRILKGGIKNSPVSTGNGESLLLKARITRSSLVGLNSAMPAAFTISQLQSLFGAQNLARQQIARHTALLPLFGGLTGALDAIAPSTEAIRPATADDIVSTFAKRSPHQEARGRAAVRRDLRLHRAYDTQLHALSATRSVWDKLIAVEFSAAQLNRLLTSLAYIREGFALQRGTDGLIDPDQKGNWLHTLDELDAVLDRTYGRSPAEIERAAMGMFGDAWKTKFNFTRHNYDGAEVARLVLGRQLDSGFSAEDVTGIVEANKEHQVSPPGLMGILYANKIAGVLNAERGKIWGDLIEKAKTTELTANDQAQLAYWTEVAMEQDYRAFQQAMFRDHERDHDLSEEEIEAKKRLEHRTRFGSFITDDDYKTLIGIQSKIADPYAQKLVSTASGGMAVAMTEKERAFLKLSGIDYWHVPHESTRWFWISRTGVVADILANLGLGGRCKLTRLNGPETDLLFQLPTIRECIDSGLKTYADIDKILCEEEHHYIQSRVGDVTGAIEQAMQRVGDWLRGDPGLRDNPLLTGIPFWDVPLKYPERGADDANWWQINRIPESQRSIAQQEFWLQHRFDGLSDAEKEHYQRAIRIRDRVVEELGKELRLDNQFVPDFKPVMSRSRRS